MTMDDYLLTGSSITQLQDRAVIHIYSYELTLVLPSKLNAIDKLAAAVFGVSDL